MSAPWLCCLLAATGTSTSGEARNEGATRIASAEFIKGELANAGSIRLVPHRSFVGARLGLLLIDRTVYATAAPKADLEFLQRRLRLGLEVPLNFEVFDIRSAANEGEAKAGFENAGTLRKQDYDEARDFVKFLRYLTYGKKEDRLFVNVGQLHAFTLGHGQVMRRYASNVDINQSRVGVQVDAYNDFGGFEVALADATRGNLFALLGFVKPLSFFSADPMARSFSVGVSWATDQRAPWALQRGPAIGTSTLGPVLVDEANNPLVDTRAINIYGVDAEVKLLKTDSVDLKTYGDFSLMEGAGSGIALGVLGRFNFRSESVVQLLRTRLELRTYESNFLPSYFDTLYEFQKYQFSGRNRAFSADVATRLNYIKNRSGPRRYGFYLEATYSIPEWVAVAAAFESESEGEDRHLMLHVEVPLRYLDLFATYHQRNFAKLFTLGENDIVFAGARLQLLPVLFLNGRLQKSFAWDPAAFDGLGSYGEALNYQVDVEFGFEI